MRSKIYVLILAFINLTQVYSHGWLDEPVARSSAWLYNNKFGSIFPAYYDHTQMNCGTYEVFMANGQKCGICGEDIKTVPKQFEKGGKMYVGEIVQTYSQGQTIQVSVDITANHVGYSEFLICNVDNLATDATQECLNKIILKDTMGQSKFTIIPNYHGPINTTLVLPADLKCNHCVFQWRWTTGNRWNTDPVTGQSCIGCGPQEQFYGCADVRILGKGETTPKPTGTPSPNRVPLYGQCGGIGYTGPTTCQSGINCYAQSDHYSQCLTSCPSGWKCESTKNSDSTLSSTNPTSISTSNKITLSTLIKSTTQSVVPMWGQCGGLTYNGLTKCISGTTCFIQSEWYSQCLTSCPSGWKCV